MGEEEAARKREADLAEQLSDPRGWGLPEGADLVRAYRINGNWLLARLKKQREANESLRESLEEMLRSMGLIVRRAREHGLLSAYEQADIAKDIAEARALMDSLR